MKTTILIFLLPLLAIAQGNFKLENDNLIWQRIYQTELSESELMDELNRTGNFEIDGNILTVIPRDIDRVEDATIKGYLISHNYTAKAIIDYKEGRYRVIMKNIILEDVNTIVLQFKGNKYDLKLFATNKKGFRKAFANNDYKYFEESFNNLFVLNQNNDDW